MRETQREKCITESEIKEYEQYLYEQERSLSTVQKYVHDVRTAAIFLNGAALTKPKLIAWKEHLAQCYAPTSVNAMLAAINSFLDFMGWTDLKVKPLKIQKSLFREESRELNRADYTRLVRAAEQEGNERLSLVIQTICATGIRVSELKFITAEGVRAGHVEVSNKGKRRTVFLPEKLRWLLKRYLEKEKRPSGPVFVTRNGRPLDRSNIWREMKALCKSAGVEPGKVFPHNLRHLFARTYYSIEKDLSRLADILGHSNVNTTKIYTMESGLVHARQIERLGLIVT